MQNPHFKAERCYFEPIRFSMSKNSPSLPPTSIIPSLLPQSSSIPTPSHPSLPPTSPSLSPVSSSFPLSPKRIQPWLKPKLSSPNAISVLTSVFFYSSKPPLLTILSVNIRSLLPKINDLSLLLLLFLIDILCMCETWLSSDISSSELYLPGFTLFRTDRSRKGGGVAIYARSPLNPVLQPLSPNSLELCSISVSSGNHTFNIDIVCFYRPPTASSDVDSLIDLLSSQGPSFTSRLILVGDFNINFEAPPSTVLANQLSAISDTLSLKQFVLSPTHYSPSVSPSIIDLVFSPTPLHPKVSVLNPMGSSDHNSILISIPTRSKTPTSNSPPKTTYLDLSQGKLSSN